MFMCSWSRALEAGDYDSRETFEVIRPCRRSVFNEPLRSKNFLPEFKKPSGSLYIQCRPREIESNID